MVMSDETKKSAFEYFGTIQTNERWSWSAVSGDGSVVAVVIWKDHIKYENQQPYYDGFDEYHEEGIHAWGGRQGNQNRKVNLAHAVEKLDGMVRVVIGVAKNTEADPREIHSIYPMKHLWFKIEKFDEDTGQFRLKYSHKDES